jgi:hypothetical protein
MILGLVIPRLNLTWFATRVEHVTVDEKELAMPTKKATHTDVKTFSGEIWQAVKRWGDEAAKIYWKVMI